MPRHSYARIWAVVFILAFMAGTSCADILDPYVFGRGRIREKRGATFRLTPSPDKENALVLEVNAATDGLCSYSLFSVINDSCKVMESLRRARDKGRHSFTFVFPVPEEGGSSAYVLEASFTPVTRRKDNVIYSEAAFTRNITVRMNGGKTSIITEGR